jgi:hypothetical protein
MKEIILRRRFALLLVALALIAWPAAAAAQPSASPPQAVAAKSCSAGYKHAVIGGQHKCLRAGQFCTHSYDTQYRRYGYRCTKYYRNVSRYRLTYA